MPKNIVIFSDGTGQRGGILVDEKRSNIYKLYRATRCGPDTAIDPREQLAYYDPGIGTLPPGLGTAGTMWAKFRNLVSQALGLGLTANIIDCYAAIIRLWQPGDRIFLFGFSRGAYTIRCLGAVIGACGIPQQAKGGGPLRRDEASTHRIAREAVKHVYQHTESRREDEATEREKQLLAQRRTLAQRFRKDYGSDLDGHTNAYPYFIGVFDTVASLANPVMLVVLGIVALFGVALVSTLLWSLGVSFWIFGGWWSWFIGLALLVGGVSFAANLVTRWKWEIGVEPWSWRRPFHLTRARMEFYDTELSPKVPFARHALSIDEARTSFRRVSWGTRTVARGQAQAAEDPTGPRPFEQIWFSGNHSDIGGSYPENESRLSDIALQWMVEAATDAGLKIDPSLLKLYPDPEGPQHDETRSSLFRFAGKEPRKIPKEAVLHPSVIERINAREVLHYDVMQPYRPVNLNRHVVVGELYEKVRDTGPDGGKPTTTA
jgi:uncharacterized protein (DUF2235 family)